MILRHGIEPSDRPLIEELLASLSAFTDGERAVALELVDTRLAHPTSDDYRFILSFSEEPRRLAGYLCYGRTPMTQSTYDLYWIGTSPEHARSGVARGLVTSMESEIARAGGGLVRIETGSREGHGAAVHFYDAIGCARAATLPDFYAPGDDLIIFTRRVPGEAHDGATATATLDDAALYDAAFGYRDHAVERDFLLACARRFGGRDVRRVLAWACGPARHLLAFADAGVACIGADASEAMIAYARRIAGPRGGSADLQYVRAALDQPLEGVPEVDLSFVPLSSIHLLTDPDAIERHLHAAAARLRPGGLHVIEATHPGDLSPSGPTHTEWTEVRGGEVVDARFRMHLDRMTPDRVIPVTLDVTRSPGKKAANATQQRLHQEDRWFIPDLPGWRAIVAAVPELSLVAELGDFNVDVRFEHSAAWRLILVLRRV